MAGDAPLVEMRKQPNQRGFGVRPAPVTAKPQPQGASLSIQTGRRKTQPEVCDSNHILSFLPLFLPSTPCWAGATEGTPPPVIMANAPDVCLGFCLLHLPVPLPGNCYYPQG